MLTRGERGTATSMAVHGLTATSPEIGVAIRTCGCASGSLNVSENGREQRAQNQEIECTKSQVRVVDLPVSAIENRTIGTLDLEAALTRGERRFEPDLHVLDVAARLRRHATGFVVFPDRSAGAPMGAAAIANYWCTGAVVVRGVGRKSSTGTLDGPFPTDIGVRYTRTH